MTAKILANLLVCVVAFSLIAGSSFGAKTDCKFSGTSTNTSISITFEFPDGFWCAMGFGNNQMTNTYMVRVEQSGGEVTATDMYATGRKRPDDKDNTWTVKDSKVSGGTVTATIERSLEGVYYSFKPGQSDSFIHAHRKGSFGYHGKDRYIGQFKVPLGGGDVVFEDASMWWNRRLMHFLAFI